MRKIGIPEIEDIATGAALLGAGGGGDPYVGKLVAIGAVQECGPVTLLDPAEVPDDALVVPIAMMGAPTVLAEKAIGGNEYKKLFDMVSKFFGREIYAFMPIEAGGVNSMLPIAAAARLNMPMVDVDGMGRAFPELQMVTFTIGGIKATPMALVDEKGNSCIFETITNKWTEELARSVTMSCGASVSVSLYSMSGKQMKEFGVHGIVTRSQRLGEAIRTIKDCGDRTPEEHFLEKSEGFKLFKGKIADVLRETPGRLQRRQGRAGGHRRVQGSHRLCGVPERESDRHSGRQDPGYHPRPHFSGGYGDIHPRYHRRPQVRQTRHGGRPQVLPPVADGKGHRAGRPTLFRCGHGLHSAGRALQGGN